VTNALRDAGVPFHASRHECGAVCMADGYARVSGRLPACSVHQGPGLTNTVTGLTEAAKARTPMIVLAADVPAAALRSNFRIDQTALVESVGAVAERVHSGATALADTARAVRRARTERRPVVLMLPLDVQAQETNGAEVPSLGPELAAPRPAEESVRAAADVIAAARAPAIIAGRGAVLAGAGPALRRLGELTGAVLATSAMANGLFAGDPYDLGISGGFASPLAAELLSQSDAVVAFGAALNQWTTKHGALIAPGARVVQVDLEADAIGAHRPADVGVIGDARETAAALAVVLEARGADGPGRRTPELAQEIHRRRWIDEPYEESDAGFDPRTLSIALDDVLPDERTVVVDSGHFMGWPSMYLRVPDAEGFVFPQAFQCVGLGLGNAIGAAFARPDRLTVAALGDGGALLALPEFETLGRLGLPLLVVIYDDSAYGAEVHHFRPMGHRVDIAQFPDTDFAALAAAAGCIGVTARSAADLSAVREWVQERDRPLVLDAKVDPDICAEWLEEAFRGH
jgi:thiamine pyrophosphate-dependent acetolactate synthase large subunit-like protein